MYEEVGHIMISAKIEQFGSIQMIITRSLKVDVNMMVNGGQRG